MTSFTQKGSTLRVVMASSALTLVMIVVLGYVLVNEYKADIFDYLASNYIEEYENDERDAGEVSQRNLLSGESVIVDLIEEVNPAVVSVVVTKDVPTFERYYEEFGPFGLPFRIPQYREDGTEERQIGGGSGFFVSPDGMVVTNKHVVADDDASYTVITSNGEQHEAMVLARDPFLDIAVLEIEAKDVPYLEFGDSEGLKLGQSVIAIGNALGEFQNSVSVGIVSGLSRSLVAGDLFGGRSEVLEGVIQTDAAINPGNSGGPLIDLSGKVVGVNVAVARGSENIGFSLPATAVKSSVDSVKEHGEIVRPYIGVRFLMVNRELQEQHDLSVDHGALVLPGGTGQGPAVIPGSPADKAGIVENDIIIAVEGKRVDDDTSLGMLIRQYDVGDAITLTVLREGEERDIEVTLERAPEQF